MASWRCAGVCTQRQAMPARVSAADTGVASRPRTLPSLLRWV
jgi:hypothetical protein